MFVFKSGSGSFSSHVLCTQMTGGEELEGGTVHDVEGLYIQKVSIVRNVTHDVLL
jgi:hypothetical protein